MAWQATSARGEPVWNAECCPHSGSRGVCCGPLSCKLRRCFSSLDSELGLTLDVEFVVCSCTHLTVDTVLARDKVADLRQSGVRSLAHALLAGPTAAFWSQRTFTVRRRLLVDGRPAHRCA